MQCLSYNKMLSVFILMFCFNYAYAYHFCTDKTGIIVNLSNQNFTSVPKNIPKNTTTLDLSFNQITTIRAKDFQSLENLKCLILNFNPISHIKGEAFWGLRKLKVLEMNSHSLDYKGFNADVFLPIQTLQNLSMRTDKSVANNKINAFGILENFKNLTTVSIDTAPETVFYVNFDNLRKIKQLIIGSLDSFDCGLQVLKNSTFQKISNLGVEYLDLSHCTVVEIQDGFLKPLENLKTFLLVGGLFPVKVGIPELIRSLRFYMNKSMTEINLSSPVIESQLMYQDLTIISMEILGYICVEKLILSECDINIINTVNFFVQMKSGQLRYPCFGRCIRHLDLSNNRLTGRYFKPEIFFFAFMENLEFLDVSGQYIYERRYESNFAFTHPTHSDISPLKDLVFFMPKKLKYFNLGGGAYRIGRLVDIKFENAYNLRYLNFSLTGLYYFNATLSGFSNVQIVDFSGNDVRIIRETFFDTFPSVTYLRLADCYLDGNLLLTNGRRLFQPLKKLEKLDLSRNNLIKLPIDIFVDLNELKMVDLAFNDFFSHPDYLNTNLHVLYLNFNNFIKFSSKEIHMFNKLEKKRKGEGKHLELYLFGNSLACECETYEFVTWLNSTTIQLDRPNYACIDTNSDIISIKDFNQIAFIQLCLASFWLNISISLAATMLVIIVSVFVVIKNKLLVKIFIQRLLGKYVYPKRRQDFKFDAYIIYPESVYKLVCFDMVEYVEKRSALKFYIPHRDQLFGVCKVDDITESCKNCWKLVLILTQEFIDDPLAYFILSSCLTSITLTTPYRLILIIDSNLNILPNIDFFIESVSESNVLYADLNGRLPGEFWAKLTQYINHNDIN